MGQSSSIETTLDNEIKNYDTKRTDISGKMGLNSTTLLPNNKSFNIAMKNPSFDIDNSYLHTLKLPTETSDFLKKVNTVRTRIKQNEIDTLKTRYENITNAIKMYQQDEKQIWLNMNVAKDPQYMRKREAYLIYQKILKLKKQRDELIHELRKKYDNSTNLQEFTKQLDSRNKFIIDNQMNIIERSKRQIYDMNSDIMTKRRQAQIDMYMINKYDYQVLMLRVLLVGILLCCIPLLLIKIGIGSDHLNGKITIKGQTSPPNIMTYMLIFVIVTLLVLIGIYLKYQNVNRLDWNVHNFSRNPPTIASLIGLGSTDNSTAVDNGKIATEEQEEEPDLVDN